MRKSIYVSLFLEQNIHIGYFFQDLTRSTNFVEILRKVRHQEQQEQQQQQSHS